MKQPTTEDELLALHKLCQTDPEQYLRVTNEWISENPCNADAYFSRHYAWLKLGEPDRALDDINTVIKLDPSELAYTCRAKIHRRIGNYQHALQDYERIERDNPELWREDWFSLLYQADSYARLGQLGDALRCWELLPADFWTPGMNDAPPGNKVEIQEELLRIAATSRQNMT
jgi:tetratricopeptide (TPR) repeat protein